MRCGFPKAAVRARRSTFSIESLLCGRSDQCYQLNIAHESIKQTAKRSVTWMSDNDPDKKKENELDLIWSERAGTRLILVHSTATHSHQQAVLGLDIGCQKRPRWSLHFMLLSILMETPSLILQLTRGFNNWFF